MSYSCRKVSTALPGTAPPVFSQAPCVAKADPEISTHKSLTQGGKKKKPPQLPAKTTNTKMHVFTGAIQRNSFSGKNESWASKLHTLQLLRGRRQRELGLR